MDLKINSPNEIKNKHLIIICSTAIKEISEQLENMDFKANMDYVISPILNDLLAIDELEQLKTTLYFTSGSVPTEKHGGGLYRIDVNKDEINIKKEFTKDHVMD